MYGCNTILPHVVNIREKGTYTVKPVLRGHIWNKE